MEYHRGVENLHKAAQLELRRDGVDPTELSPGQT